MRRRLLAFALTSAIGLCLAVAVWRGEASGTVSRTSPGGAPAARRVSLATVESRDVPLTIEVAGNVAPLHTVGIRPLVTAVIEAVAVKDGQQVRKGDRLFTLRNDLLLAEREKSRAQLARDKVALADLERQFARATNLQSQQFVSQSAVDALEAQLDAQKALVSASSAAVRVADATVDRLSLYAPFDGRVGKVNVSVGSRVSDADDVPLVSLSQLNPIGVDFALPAAQLKALLPDASQGVNISGAKLTVSTQGSGQPCRQAAVSDSGSMRGTVDFVDSSIDAATGVLRMRGTFSNVGNALWPGQYVVVRVEVATLSAANVVPQAAVIQRDARKMVFVVQKDATVQLRDVRRRYADGSLVAVEGVAVGERVVVEGKHDLVPGSRVEESTSPVLAESARPADVGCVAVVPEAMVQKTPAIASARK